jgi:hypothetical protein
MTIMTRLRRSVARARERRRREGVPSVPALASDRGGRERTGVELKDFRAVEIGGLRKRTLINTSDKERPRSDTHRGKSSRLGSPKRPIARRPVIFSSSAAIIFLKPRHDSGEAEEAPVSGHLARVQLVLERNLSHPPWSALGYSPRGSKTGERRRHGPEQRNERKRPSRASRGKD